MLAYEKLTSGINVKREKIAALKQQDVTSQTEISQRQTRLTTLREQIRQEEASLAVAKTEMADKTQTLQNLDKQNSDLKVKLAEQELTSATVEKNLKEGQNRKNIILNKIAAGKTQETYLRQESQKLTEQIRTKKNAAGGDSPKTDGARDGPYSGFSGPGKTEKTIYWPAKEKRSQVEKAIELCAWNIPRWKAAIRKLIL